MNVHGLFWYKKRLSTHIKLRGNRTFLLKKNRGNGIFRHKNFRGNGIFRHKNFQGNRISSIFKTILTRIYRYFLC